MPYRELSVEQIEEWIGLKREEVPRCLVLHAIWPWGRDNELRRYIEKPRCLAKIELGNFWVGKFDDHQIGYMKVFGPGMAADMLYVLIKLGVKYVFQIGSMGSLQEHIRMFDLVIPSECIKYEGLDHHFSQNTSKCDDFLLNIVRKKIEEKEFRNLHVGKTISIDFLFAETEERVKNWSEQGLLAIDMETASTYAMCNELGAKAISILFVSDNMVRKGELMSDRVYRIDRSKTRTKRRELIRDIIFETIEELMITTT